MNKTRLRILFLSSWFPSRAHSTLGNFVQRHAEAVALNNEVHVLYITGIKTGAKGYSVHTCTENGVRITRVYFTYSRFKKLHHIKGFKLGINHLLKDGKLPFDLVHHNVIWPMGWQALYIKKKFGLPYIITEHFTIYDTQARNDQPRLLKWLSKKVVGGASAICPVSTDLGKKMQHYGLAGKYITVPNVVNAEHFTEAAVPGITIRFLHVSSLWDHQKNISGILHAWKKASEQRTDIELHIGGDGDHKRWQAEALAMGIRQESIYFFGEQTPAGIAGMMQQSHCLILFSNYENLPVVIVEAMACGIPVISTDVGGISEHINGTRGLLIKAGDIDELTQAILEMAGSTKNYDKQQIREYALTHFSMQAVGNAFQDVYQQVLSS